MPEDRHPALFADSVADLAARGIRLAARAGEYCVNFADGAPTTAYVTDDLMDAIEHGWALARSLPGPDTAPVSPLRRRRRPARMTAKAIRRRAIRRHNRRLRARMLRGEPKA